MPGSAMALAIYLKAGKMELNEFLVTAIALSRRRDIRTYLNELLDDIESLSGGESTITWVDAGIVDVSDLASGAVVLYTTDTGEYVSSIRFGETIVDPDQTMPAIEFHIGAWNSVDSNSYGFFAQGYDLRDSLSVSLGQTGGPRRAAFNNGSNFVYNVSPPMIAGALTATLANFGTSRVGLVETWQSNHLYTDQNAIIENGHYWDGSGAGGTSGSSKPNFAAHFGGSVTDNTMIWWDEGPVPTVGSVHVFIEIIKPISLTT